MEDRLRVMYLIVLLIIPNYFYYSFLIISLFLFRIMRIIGNDHVSLFPIILIIPEKKIKTIKLIRIIRIMRIIV